MILDSFKIIADRIDIFHWNWKNCVLALSSVDRIE